MLCYVCYVCYVCTYICTHERIHTYTHTHTRIHTYAHARVHARTHAYTRTHAYIHGSGWDFWHEGKYDVIKTRTKHNFPWHMFSLDVSRIVQHAVSTLGARMGMRNAPARVRAHLHLHCAGANMLHLQIHFGSSHSDLNEHGFVDCVTSQSLVESICLSKLYSAHCLIHFLIRISLTRVSRRLNTLAHLWTSQYQSPVHGPGTTEQPFRDP